MGMGESDNGREFDFGYQLERMKDNFLVVAAKAGREEEVESLVGIGAEIDWMSPDSGETPLVAACRNGHRGTAAVLLAHGGDASMACGDGETPLRAALVRGDEALSALLIDAGADGEMKVGGVSAFEAGEAEGYSEVVARLRDLAKRHSLAERRDLADSTLSTRHADSVMLPDIQKKNPPDESDLVSQLDGLRRNVRDERRDKAAAEARVSTLRDRVARLEDDLARVKLRADSGQAEADRLRTTLRRHSGYDLAGVGLDELANLERDANSAAQRIAKYRAKLALLEQTRLPDAYVCPITRDVMRDPVVCADGHTYERRAIQQWLVLHDTSPKTGLVLANKHLVPNFAIKSAIDDLRSHPALPPPTTAPAPE